MEGNDRFEGFSVDLIDGISKMLGFKYILRLVEDNAYGSYNEKTKKWNGLVKELLDRVRLSSTLSDSSAFVIRNIEFILLTESRLGYM